jgi:hypothetical protein
MGDPCTFIRVKVMMFNATFKNISVISWQSVLLLEEAIVPGKNLPTSHKSLTNLNASFQKFI